jgi:uncharacterized membrane protein YtjA (UPF0391 family)
LFVQQYIARGADVTRALIFLVVEVVDAVLGFGGTVGEAAWIAKVLPFVFLILLVVALIMGRKGLSSGLGVGQRALQQTSHRHD